MKPAGMDMDMDSEDMMKMMGSFTVLRLLHMMGMMSGSKAAFSKEELLDINSQLNQIKKQ